MQAVICLLVLALADGLNLKARNDVDTHPKFAQPKDGAGIIWQRPKGEVKGVLVYLHGCHNYATDMFSETGPDGYKIPLCKQSRCGAHKEEMLARATARKRGYLVAAVQGGTNNERGCTNTLDVPKIQRSLKFLKAEENLIGKPIILMGMSAGARTVPELATKITGTSCNVIVANEVRVKGDSSAPLGIPQGYPEDVPAIFVYMPHDDARIVNIQKNLKQFSNHGIKTAEIKVDWGPKHFMAGGKYMDNILDFCEPKAKGAATPAAPVAAKVKVAEQVAEKYADENAPAPSKAVKPTLA